MAEQYKYDVAFSFQRGDEPLAAQLNDRLQPRLLTFIYSKKQGEVAGTDGEETFGRVFGEEARLVVVLYRKGWGETPWTRIEETAIRRRAYHRGYAFAKFVPLDDPQTAPEWLPPTQLYIGLKHYGIEATAAVIEARAQELGANPRAESAVDHAARLRRQIDFEAKRKQFRFTDHAVRQAGQAVEELHIAMETLAKNINDQTALGLIVGKRNRQIQIMGLGRALLVDWHVHFNNSLDESELDAVLMSGPPTSFPRERPRSIRSLKFDFDLLPTEATGWISRDTGKAQHSTTDLAEHLMTFYMANGRETR